MNELTAGEIVSKLSNKEVDELLKYISYMDSLYKKHGWIFENGRLKKNDFSR